MSSWSWVRIHWSLTVAWYLNFIFEESFKPPMNSGALCRSRSIRIQHHTFVSLTYGELWSLCGCLDVQGKSKAWCPADKNQTPLKRKSHCMGNYSAGSNDRAATWEVSIRAKRANLKPQHLYVAEILTDLECSSVLPLLYLLPLSHMP